MGIIRARLKRERDSSCLTAKGSGIPVPAPSDAPRGGSLYAYDQAGPYPWHKVVTVPDTMDPSGRGNMAGGQG